MNPNDTELTYWVALAGMPHMPVRRRNELYVKCYKHTPRISVIELVECRDDMAAPLELTPAEAEEFRSVRESLGKTAFMVEDLLNQGYTILPFDSPRYPASVKRCMKIESPTVLFVKGDPALLAGEDGTLFAVAGAADAARFDRAVTDGGQRGVIVLPQGITTYVEGFEKYYRPMVRGRLAMVSATGPKAPRSIEHMALSARLLEAFEDGSRN